jgi:TolA-binding protein
MDEKKLKHMLTMLSNTAWSLNVAMTDAANEGDTAPADSLEKQIKAVDGAIKKLRTFQRLQQSP